MRMTAERDDVDEVVGMREAAERDDVDEVALAVGGSFATRARPARPGPAQPPTRARNPTLTANPYACVRALLRSCVRAGALVRLCACGLWRRTGFDRTTLARPTLADI